MCENNEYNKNSRKFYFSSGVIGRDSDKNSRWYLAHILPSASKSQQGLSINVKHPDVSAANELRMTVDASGTSDIHVSHPEAWSSAIGIGPFRSTGWKATSSNANGTQLTNKITGLNKGVYLCIATSPVLSANLLMSFTGTPGLESNTYFTGSTSSTNVRLLPIYSDNTSIWIQSSASTSCNFTYTERGELRVIRLRTNPNTD